MGKDKVCSFVNTGGMPEHDLTNVGIYYIHTNTYTHEFKSMRGHEQRAFHTLWMAILHYLVKGKGKWSVLYVT